MTYSTTLLGTDINYTVRVHPRARRTKLTLYPDGSIVATIPKNASEKAALRLIKEKQSWILKHILNKSRDSKHLLPKILKSEAPYLKQQAKIYINHRLRHFNTYYGFSYNRFFVKDMKSQWGSCSYKKNLNYNFRLILLSEELADTVIAHELCHLKEMNHSKKFWGLVGETINDCRKKEREVHQYLIQ